MFTKTNLNVIYFLEFMEYRTSLVTKPENPHDATKQPVHGVLKLTPELINRSIKTSKARSAKKIRKSII